MALERFNGFTYDNTTSLASEGWTFAGTAVVTAGAGPNGAAGLVCNADKATTVRLNTHATHTIGFNLLLTGTPPSTSGRQSIAILTSLGNNQVAVYMESNYKLSFYKYSSSSTLLGTTTHAFSPGQQAHIQLKMVCGSGTSGSLEVRINGNTSPDLLVSGVDTKGYTGNATWDGFTIGGGSGLYGCTLTIANFWSTDGSGSAPYNSFLGECRVNAFLPSGAGNSAGLTPSAGSNYQCVDEATLDASDYVSGTTGKDTYDFPNLGFTPLTLYAFAIKPTGKKSDAGTRYVAGVVRYSGADTSDATQAMSQTDTTHVFIHTTHPDGTSGALSGLSGSTAETMFNACEFGVEIS